MAHISYPAYADLYAMLNGLRLSLNLEVMGLDWVMAAAVAEWERVTRWTPFLAVAGTRVFDPPGPEKSRGSNSYVGWGYVRNGGGTLLTLGCGLVSVSALAVDINEYAPAGTALTQNADFWLEPTTAQNDGKPFTLVRFRSAVYGQPQSISITGSFGYGSTVPDDVWTAILHYAGFLASPSIAMQISSGMVKVQEADESRQWDPRVFSAQADMWQTNFLRVANSAKYKRISL